MRHIHASKQFPRTVRPKQSHYELRLKLPTNHATLRLGIVALIKQGHLGIVGTPCHKASFGPHDGTKKLKYRQCVSMSDFSLGEIAPPGEPTKKFVPLVPP